MCVISILWLIPSIFDKFFDLCTNFFYIESVWYFLFKFLDFPILINQLKSDVISGIFNVFDTVEKFNRFDTAENS